MTGWMIPSIRHWLIKTFFGGVEVQNDVLQDVASRIMSSVRIEVCSYQNSNQETSRQ